MHVKPNLHFRSSFLLLIITYQKKNENQVLIDLILAVLLVEVPAYIHMHIRSHISTLKNMKAIMTSVLT